MSEEIQDKGVLRALIVCAGFVIMVAAALALSIHSKPAVPVAIQITAKQSAPVEHVPVPIKAVPKRSGEAVATTAPPPKAPVVTAPPTTTTTVPDSALSPIELAHRLGAKRFGEKEWPALRELWMLESKFSPTARNPSGACGIPQALPCSKIKDMSVRGQIQWGLDYIAGKYHTPSRALAFWWGTKPKKGPQGHWY